MKLAVFWGQDVTASHPGFAVGIRVNAIAPGAVRTDIWNVPGMSEEQAKAHEQAITGGIPMWRFGTPEEIANVTMFLVSDKASYVTGSVYAADGSMGA